MTNTFNKVAEDKINNEKIISSFCIYHNCPQKEIKKTILVTTDSKINQPTNLIKEGKDLCNENFKPVMTKTEEDNGKWKDLSHSCTGGIRNIPVRPKQCTKSMQSHQMLILFFTETKDQS